jgi:DNA-nicking Smr family endonuclease
MPPRQRLSDQDRADWAAYARQVRLLPGKKPIQTPLTQPTQAGATAPLPQPTRGNIPGRQQPALVTGEHPPGLDRATWNRFRTGKTPAARTLDLHGKTADAAHRALTHFLHAAQADQIRCVEIITGRGSGEHGGVIRRELPHWLNQPALRPVILAASHPHALNPGSTRLLLRRTGSRQA